MKTVIITTANNMTDETYQYICDGLKRKYNDELEFQRIIDESIIGGFIARVDSEIFDMSVLAQLNEMKKHIAG